MIRRESFETKPDRAPYFWTETPIGRLCFRRNLPSQERSWLNSVQRAGQELHAESVRAKSGLTEEGVDIADLMDSLALMHSRVEAAQGLYIARHWVDEEYTLDATATYKAGGYRPDKEWGEDLPALVLGSDRWGWMVMQELANEGLDISDIIRIFSAVKVGAEGSPQPTQADVDDKMSFSDAPKATTTSP